MTAAPSSIDRETIRHRRVWSGIMIASLAPGVFYLLLLVLALGFHHESPGKWVVERFALIPAAYPMSVALVIGGPILSGMANLILQLPPAQKPNQLDNKGIFIWLVAILCVMTMFPFPWLVLVYDI